VSASPLMRRTRHLSRRQLAFAFLVAAVLFSGCLSIQEQTLEQQDFIGPVEVTTSFCAADDDECKESGSDAMQLMLGHRVPTWADAPATVRVDGTVGGELHRSQSYEQELERLDPAPAGSRWIGYLSRRIEVPWGNIPEAVAHAEFGVPHSAAGTDFVVATALGVRELGHESDGTAPVSCGEVLDQSHYDDASGDSTRCAATREDPREVPTRGLAVNAPEAPVAIEQGASAVLDVATDWKGPGLPDGETVEFEVEDGVGCLQVGAVAAVAPNGPATSALPVSISVPAGAPAASTTSRSSPTSGTRSAGPPRGSTSSRTLRRPGRASASTPRRRSVCPNPTTARR